VGRTELLAVINDEFAKKFDFSDVLYHAEGMNIRTRPSNDPWDQNKFEKTVLEELMPIIKGPHFKTVLNKTIRNTHRSFGAMISGQIAAYYGKEGLPKELITINLEGTAGQSFGAFLSHGMLLNLRGGANDYVGKGMSGGHIIITPKDRKNQDRNLAGNTCLYGATGGKLFIAGNEEVDVIDCFTIKLILFFIDLNLIKCIEVGDEYFIEVV
jgi:glutamate synthase (NADPH/NADH) large chain